MKVLFTGKGTSGSWACRGDQLGRACGATVKPQASVQDMRAHDLVVVVKRVSAQLLSDLRAAGTPWVLDVVDFYPQPIACSWTRDEAAKWVRQSIVRMWPTAVIWPNHQMSLDCMGNLPSSVLYHHHRPGIALNPIREQVKVIGYEGCPAYLGEWHPFLREECARRGWKFLINPESLADLDIVVAVRGSQFTGYVPSRWKSNVKLANAMGSGTPFVGNREMGYLETARGHQQWADNKAEMQLALDALTPYEARLKAREGISSRYSVDDAARDLMGFLHGL